MKGVQTKVKARTKARKQKYEGDQMLTNIKPC